MSKNKAMDKKLQKKQDLVVKHNNLIEAKYKLSLQEQKFIVWLISQIKKDDKDFQTYEITVKDFSKLLSIHTKNSYKIMIDLSENILTRILKIYNKKEDTTLNCNWVSSIKYHHGSGFMDVRFDPELKKYLLQLKQEFTKYNLKAVMKLNSVYSIRIYELLKQYLKIKKRVANIQKLKELLSIENKYKQYNNFKRKVLLVAQKEVNKKTDIHFKFSEIKQGRKVVSIEFTISENTQKEHDTKYIIDFADIKQKELYQKLIDYFLLSPNQAQLVLERYKIGYINDVLSYVENKIREGVVENIGAYTKKGLKEGWKIQESLFEDELKEEKQQQRKEEEEEEKQRKIDSEKGEKIFQSMREEIKEKVIKKICENNNYIKSKIELFKSPWDIPVISKREFFYQVFKINQK
jgi:plasmid replication initiation protein